MAFHDGESLDSLHADSSSSHAGNRVDPEPGDGTCLLYRDLPILLTRDRFITWATDFYFASLQDAGFPLMDSIASAHEYQTRARNFRGLALLNFAHSQVESNEYPLFFASFEAVFGRKWSDFYKGAEDASRMQ